MKRKKLVIANWKMNPGSAKEVRALLAKTKRAASRLDSIKTVICPPFPYLSLFGRTSPRNVALGAQDVFTRNGGAFTGEVSPEMLRDLGVSYAIVGHSERRALGESDALISEKARAAMQEGMSAVLCVGERERTPGGEHFQFLRAQLAASLGGIPARLLYSLVVAYEPVFAIGRSAREALSPRDIEEAAIFIKKVLTEERGAEVAGRVPILYGGAVEEKNAGAILSETQAAGFLVGHKSLDAEAFLKLLRSADACA